MGLLYLYLYCVMYIISAKEAATFYAHIELANVRISQLLRGCTHSTHVYQQFVVYTS